MANKAFSDLTAATVISTGDLIAIETSGGNSRKVTADRAGLAAGTSFPGSPASGDVFRRTDRNIEYVYDGTRWLSVDIHTLNLAANTTTYDLAATDTAILRALNPWSGLYDIYVEQAVFGASLTTTGGWTLNLTKLIGAVSTNLVTKAITYPGTTNWTVYRENVGAVVESTTTLFLGGATETSGTSTLSLRIALTYRLVG